MRRFVSLGKVIDVDGEDIEDATLVEDETKKNEPSKSLAIPDKLSSYDGYNSRTRVITKREGESQLVKVKVPHECHPPTLRAGDLGKGSIWKCPVGHKWKVKRHIFCDDDSHMGIKWAKKRLFFLTTGYSFT